MGHAVDVYYMDVVNTYKGGYDVRPTIATDWHCSIVYPGYARKRILQARRSFDIGGCNVRNACNSKYRCTVQARYCA